MCGILCLISKLDQPTVLRQLFKECKCQNNHRGPNYQETVNYYYNDTHILMTASVLWLQGEAIVKQPIITPKSLFSYNGDIFGGDAISEQDCLTQGDTKLFQELVESSKNIIESLQSIQGPYAIISYDKVKNVLHFGRDVFGRRSLLLIIDKENDAFLLTSVAVRTKMPTMEVPAIGIFSFSLVDQKYSLNAWPRRNVNFASKLSQVTEFLSCDINLISTSNVIYNMFTPPTDDDLNHFKYLRGLSIDNGYKHLLSDDNWRKNVLELNAKLENALKRRIRTQPKWCRDCLNAKQECKHCRVGILFSGGVDCTILALLADKFIEKDCPIDLMNVAFSKSKDSNDYETPDRKTGLLSLQELKILRPDREWNFVEINVPEEELKVARASKIADLIFPLNSVLDDSLGCALWFASRCQTYNYTSPCRVLLVGMGADELFGGYTRHRAAFKCRGWQGLHDVLEDDWANIAHRNLARDDRVVADHGRQLRTPYLDEEVVDFVRSLRVWEKTYPTSDLVQGFGEKILLRTLAYYLGLECAATFPKRALQFGSRIADKRENAHEVSPRLGY